MGEGRVYVQFETIRYSYGGIDRTCRLALDFDVAARVREMQGELSGMGGEDRLDELLDIGAVFHDDIDENGMRVPSERWMTMNGGQLREVMRAYRLHGRLDNPIFFVPAYLKRSTNALRILVRSFWEDGLLNDPAFLVPALMKFGFHSVADDFLPCQNDAGAQQYVFGDEAPSGALLERYRAHCRGNAFYDPAPDIAAEQWRNPETGHIYCAHWAGLKRYCANAEIRALEERLAALKLSAPPYSPPRP
ncbi:MAG: hypothetical protein HY370_03730 [Proteobacteria bacterium]|nr:hypothetical protein [Pseudomonadota bacterium]